jgi:protein-tyrosine-phosphatase
MAGLYSKGLNAIDLREYRLVINLSEHSLAGRIPTAHTGRVLHRPVLDPYGGSLSVYRQSRDAIQQVITRALCREEEP